MGEQFRIVIECHSLPGDRLAGKRAEDMHDPGIGQRNAAGPVSWMTAPEPANSPAPIMVR
jgi:hypothetical protein